MDKIRHLYRIAINAARRNKSIFGLPLVYLALVLFATLYILGAASNLVLFLLVALVVAGIAGYVYQEKHSGKY